MTILHKDIKPVAGDPLAGAHVLHYYTFNDVAAMNAGTDTLLGAVVFAASDVGRIAQVGAAAPYDYYVLTDHTGPTWELINSGSGGSARIYVTGSTNQTTTLIASEQVVGGFVFDPTDYTASTVTISLEFFGVMTLAGAGEGRLRLYDMGAPGAPAAGVIVSSVAIPNGSANIHFTASNVLTPVAVLANPDEILNSARMYELRLFLSAAAAPGDELLCLWGGIVVDSSL